MFEKVRGFRDAYPEEMKPRQKIFDLMRQSAIKFCFNQIEIPSLEYLDLYRIKSGDELIGQTYSFIDKGGRELTMVPEATPSVVRMLTARKDIGRPVKWFCMPKLWRYEEPQSGRTREHTQFNADIFGDDSVYADAEVIGLACNILDNIGLKGKYKVRVNSRKLMENILIKLGISDIFRGYSLIDHYKKITKEELEKELVLLSGNSESSNILLDLLESEIPIIELVSRFPEKFIDGNLESVSRLV
ncbi:histidyl-tRNA synthetase, partial [mine drainage metagenome]